MNPSEPEIYYLVRSFDGHKSIVKSRDYPKGFQSTSPGCEDLVESKKKWGVLDAPCVECGELFGTNYGETYKSKMIRDNICFGCNHWREMVGHNGSAKQVIVEGVHFLICNEAESGPSRWRGHGGSRFTIKFKDGRVETSTNLWCQGTIPAHFKERLPNNAEFVWDQPNPTP